jgi:cytochrome c2
MDSFELNKIVGAVLFALLVSFGLKIGAEILFETEAPESPGYVIAVAEQPAEGETAGATAERQPIALLLASADAAAGEASAKKCATCHSFGEGEAAKVGPNLYAVVGRPIAGTDYDYDEAMHAYAEQAKVWSYDNLDAFLHDPKGTVPGTKMAFAGLKKDDERANVIAYLRTLAATPEPLPEAPAAAPAEAAAPAAGQPAAGEAATQGQGQGAAASAEQGAQPAAPPVEGAGESGTAGQSGQPQGSLGAVDSVPADQQGAVPQVTPAEQPRPEPPAGGAEPQTGTAAQQGQQPAAPAAEQPAAAPAQQPAQQPATQPAAPAQPAVPPPPASGQQGAAPAAGETTVAQNAPAAAAAPAPTAPAAAPAPAAPAAAAPAGGFATLVASADPKKGEALARRCSACHSFEEGGPNKVGPHLWDVVNRPVASVPDFVYSDAMKAFSEGGAKTWTYDELSAFLANPKAHVPGTKMAFPGLRKEDDRAAVIAYLRSLSQNPQPLPAQ